MRKMNARVGWLAVLLAVSALGAPAAEIKLAAPENGATLELLTPIEKEFLANADKRGVCPPEPQSALDEFQKKVEEYKKRVAAGEKKAKTPRDGYNFYEHNDYTGPLMKRRKEEVYRPLKWQITGNLTALKVVCSETADFARAVELPLGYNEKAKSWPDGALPVCLRLDTKYFWKVVAKDENGSEVVSETRNFVTSGQLPRIMRTPLFNNCRDLGGGKNAAGKKIRQGLVYRSTAPCTGINEAQIRRGIALMEGLKSELDLRSRNECQKRVQEWKEAQPETCGINHMYHEIIPYHMHYPNNLPSFRKIFEVLADKQNYPLTFHCAVGADRTGTIGFLIGAVLGRTDEQLVDDYEFTAFQDSTPRYRYCRKARELFSFLKTPYRDNVEGYLQQIGVAKEHIDALRANMIEE